MSSFDDLSKPLSKQQIASIDAKSVHKVLARTILVDGFDVVYDLKKSHDAYLHDSVTGKDFLDLFSHFASWPLSHNHPKVNNKEFIEKIGKIAIHNPANSDIYTVEMAQFVATFERVAKPKEFKHLFFVAGGTLAVENALKTAFDWKVRLNLSQGKGELGQKIIHFKEAFHGRSGYSLSLTNTQDPNKYKYFPLFNWPRVETPKATFPLVGENLTRTIEAEKRAIKHITQVLEKEADDIAAIILEPVQGEGGDNHFRAEFWQALRQLADKYNVLLIADEVQSGVGISGKFWTYEHYGIVPDIVCFGKKTQVCGIMATPRVDKVKDNVFKVSSRINSTWGGSIVDMVRATRLLEIIEEENLVQNSATVGQYLLDKLLVLQKSYPQLITNARGKGLLCAFDVPNGAICGKVKSLAYERGAIIISCGSSTIRFRPILDLTKAHVDQVYNILNAVFADLSKQSKL